jgi:hypothetical protein
MANEPYSMANKTIVSPQFPHDAVFLKFVAPDECTALPRAFAVHRFQRPGWVFFCRQACEQ